MSLQIGDLVQVKKTVKAFYSEYAGNPIIELTPDIIGMVAGINVPVVRDVGLGTHYLVVDFHSEVTGRTERASVYPSNIRAQRPVANTPARRN